MSIFGVRFLYTTAMRQTTYFLDCWHRARAFWFDKNLKIIVNRLQYYCTIVPPSRAHRKHRVDKNRYVALCIGRRTVGQRPTRRLQTGAAMTLHIVSRDRWLYPPLSRRSSVVGGREASGGSGYCGYVQRHSKESRRVRRPYLFKQRRHRHPSAAASRLQHPVPPARHFGYCVTCVCQDRLPPCLCIIDVLSNGRNKREKKIHTHTRPLRHSHRRRCYNIASLHSAQGTHFIVSASRRPVFTAHITHTRRPWPFSARFDSKRRYYNNYAFERTAINISITFRSSRFVITRRRRRRRRRRIYANAPKPPPQQSLSSSLKNLPTKLVKHESGLVSISR